MHKELALLREECPEGLRIVEVDVFKDKETAEPYGVKVIPTQVFLAASGVEFDRHQGFLARSEIRDRFDGHGLRCSP